jgi:hypothetical protein
MPDHPASREPELLTITEAAELLRAPVATLRYWRHLGTGPRSFRLGRRVLYRYNDVQACNGRTTYQARWRDDQGQQRKKSFAKKGDADRFAATVEADKARGTYIEPSKIAVAEYARKWAESRPHRPTTARRTEMMIRLHIAGTRLGSRRLADVRPSEVQAWATDRGQGAGPDHAATDGRASAERLRGGGA